MAQWARVLAALPKILNLIPSTHDGWLKTNCNSSSRESDNSWGLHGHTHKCARTHIHINKNKSYTCSHVHTSPVSTSQKFSMLLVFLVYSYIRLTITDNVMGNNKKDMVFSV